MITREKILIKAANDCYKEMYKWAQPSIDLEEYIKNPELIKENDDNKFYTRYYLSTENTKYIIDKFIKAYHIGNDWNDNIDLLISYITNNKSVMRKYTSEENEFSEYRRYEPITPLQDITKDFEKVLNLINICKEFYKRDPELEKFNMTMYLGFSPSSNKKYVEEYWRTHERPDFIIKDFKIEDIEYPEEDDISIEEFINTLK